MSADELKPPFTRALTAAELAELPDEDIDLSDIPELGEDFWKNAIVMYPGDWEKPKVTIRLDADVIEYFKSQGRDWPTRMNAVLKSYVEAMRK